MLKLISNRNSLFAWSIRDDKLIYNKLNFFFLIIFFVPSLIFSQEVDPKVNCLNNSYSKELVESILHHPTVSKYLHYDIKARQPLKLLINQHIDPDLQIFYKANQVILTENKEKFADLLEIRFRDIKCLNDITMVSFSFLSKIEGLGISGKAVKTENGDWRIEILQVVFIWN